MNQQILGTLLYKHTQIDYSEENQKKALELAVFIMRTHQQVRRQGLGILENFKSEYPLLDRGCGL